VNFVKAKHWLSLLILIYLSASFHLVNADENSFGYRVFKMQEKMAKRGSALAQYKLGTFYEYGISVKADTDAAIIWYTKASEKRNKAAVNRLIYLDMKRKGYHEATQADWINRIQDEAATGNVHSIILLGQLHHYGIGVKKDLMKACNLLQKASSQGHTEVDDEVDLINLKMAANKPKPVAPVIVAKEKPSKPPATEAPRTSVKKKTSKSLKKAKLAEEKRRKYERVMQKLKEEALILEQQQKWSEDDSE
jgi:TPR repeat protein